MDKMVEEKVKGKVSGSAKKVNSPAKKATKTIPTIKSLDRDNIVAYVVAEVGGTKQVAKFYITAVLGAIKHLTLAESEGVDGVKLALRDFGTFVTRRTKPRVARNLHSGKEIQIKAARAVVFKPGKTWRDAIKKVK